MRTLVALAVLLPWATGLHHAPPVAPRTPAVRMAAKSAPTKAQRLVRERLNPREDIDVMTEKQLRKYAYAMQIELQRLVREEQSRRGVCKDIRRLLDQLDDRPDEDLQSVAASGLDMASLISEMKLEGLVRYGLPYATPGSSWDKVRSAHPEFSDLSDKELYIAFEASGKGISSTFGELF